MAAGLKRSRRKVDKDLARYIEEDIIESLMKKAKVRGGGEGITIIINTSLCTLAITHSKLISFIKAEQLAAQRIARSARAGIDLKNVIQYGGR